MQALELSGGELGLDLASVWEKVSAFAAKAPAYVETAMNVIEDPALPEFVGLLNKMRALEAGPPKPAEPGWAKIPLPSTAPAPSKPVGIGLKRLVAPLKLYVKYRQNPALGYAAVGGVVLILVGLGFGIGRVSKRCKVSP